MIGIRTPSESARSILVDGAPMSFVASSPKSTKLASWKWSRVPPMPWSYRFGSANSAKSRVEDPPVLEQSQVAVLDHLEWRGGLGQLAPRVKIPVLRPMKRDPIRAPPLSCGARPVGRNAETNRGRIPGSLNP